MEKKNEKKKKILIIIFVLVVQLVGVLHSSSRHGDSLVSAMVLPWGIYRAVEGVFHLGWDDRIFSDVNHFWGFVNADLNNEKKKAFEKYTNGLLKYRVDKLKLLEDEVRIEISCRELVLNDALDMLKEDHISFLYWSSSFTADFVRTFQGEDMLDYWCSLTYNKVESYFDRTYEGETVESIEREIQAEYDNIKKLYHSVFGHDLKLLYTEVPVSDKDVAEEATGKEDEEEIDYNAYFPID